ncbi:MAG TPA: hybrid sensor histidine kinase/response regulator [Aquabacterium sp.]|nr:hybrid sensor histidine kinase/response regulator [Aquabacterium sp.]
MLSRTSSLPLPMGSGKRSRYQRHAMAVLAWIALATALTLVIWLIFPGSASQASHPSVTWSDPQFRMLPTAQDPGTDWQTVSLPDTWATRQLASKGVARYEVEFQLAPLDRTLRNQTWAVRLDRLSFQHRIWLNGHLIHTDLPGDEPTGRPLSYLAQFSPDLLQDGANRLDIEVLYGSLGGLSQPIIGPADDLALGYTIQALLSQQLPLVINIVAAAFATFLIVIWLRRRSEVAMGALGWLCVVVSVRNCTYYIVHGPTLPADLSAWLYFTAQTTATVLLGWFAMAIADKRHPLFIKTLWAIEIGYPVIAGLAAQRGYLAEVRAVLYPGLLLLMLPSLALLLQVHKRFSRWSAVGIVLGIAVSLVAGFHDYLRLVGSISVNHTYWLPLASPITLASYGLVLMHRFVEATNQAEELNIQLEAKVDERTRELSAANAAKGHFLAAASHDLRQPVAAVGLLSGLLRDRLQGSVLQDMTWRLCDAVHAMEGLLNGLLDLSRLEAGAIKPHHQTIDLAAMLERIQSHEQEAARGKGLRLRIHPTCAFAHSDPVLLEQMVRNLVGNALRYTSQGGVLVGVRRRQDHWLIQVWDTGRGIAPEDQSRIFEDFVQLSNPERNRAKGLGLGLAIVQRSARLLNIHVGVQSRVGRGSCFSIAVPMAAAALSVRATPAQPSRSRPLEDRHILVIDDDDTLRLALRERLREWGALVSTGSSLEELEELLQRIMSVDLLLTDHRLRDGDSLQAIDLAREHHPDLPVVVITGDTAAEPLLTLQEIGAPVLHKPFQAEELLATLLKSWGDRRSLT